MSSALSGRQVGSRRSGPWSGRRTPHGGDVHRMTRRLLPLLAVPLVAVAACGGDDDSAAPQTTTAATQGPVTTVATTSAPTTPESTTPTTEAGTGTIGSYKDVQPAVVQIVA